MLSVSKSTVQVSRLHIRGALTRQRLREHNLTIEQERDGKTCLSAEQRPCCHRTLSEPETELHFLTKCEKYKQILGTHFQKTELISEGFLSLSNEENYLSCSSLCCCHRLEDLFCSFFSLLNMFIFRLHVICYSLFSMCFYKFAFQDLNALLWQLVQCHLMPIRLFEFEFKSKRETRGVKTIAAPLQWLVANKPVKRQTKYTLGNHKSLQSELLP